MTERRACRLANQPRGTQRYRAIRREDEDALTQAIIQLASQYGRYGYRRITALLKRAGWRVGKDRVERISTPASKLAGDPGIWRREGLKVPQKQNREDVCGSTMVRACGAGRSGGTMYGATTSSVLGRMMAAAYGFST